MSLPNQPENEEPPKRYAVRFVQDAASDLDAAFSHMADTAGFNLAQEWRTRFTQEIRRSRLLP